MIRKIYMVEAYTDDGELRIRRYAANKRTAERIAKPYGESAVIRLTSKTTEWAWIDKRDVERL